MPIRGPARSEAIHVLLRELVRLLQQLACTKIAQIEQLRILVYMSVENTTHHTIFWLGKVQNANCCSGHRRLEAYIRLCDTVNERFSMEAIRPPGSAMSNIGLTDNEQAALVRAALGAAAQSYSPYSSFRVGAALLASDGSMVTGVNVENRSYGLTICAERVAFATAIARGLRDFHALAVASPDSEYPVPPCGACRQVIGEFVREDFPIFYADRGGLRNRPLSVRYCPSTASMNSAPADRLSSSHRRWHFARAGRS